MNKISRVKPSNPGNARLLYIDGDPLECDICDTEDEAAVLQTIGGPVSTIIRICKPCLEIILGELSNEN